MEHMAGQLKVGKRFALLFGAMFILVVAVLLRVEYLFYMSFALAVTPGVAWLFARRGTLYVEASRSMTGVVKAGERLPMRIELENTGATRKQLLVMRDTLPSGLVAEGPMLQRNADSAEGGGGGPFERWAKALVL